MKHVWASDAGPVAPARTNSRAPFPLLVVLIVAASLLSACDVLSDFFHPESVPIEPMPHVACYDAPLDAVDTVAHRIGEWPADDYGASLLRITRYSVPVPRVAPNVSRTFTFSPETFENRYPPPRTYHALACRDRLVAIWQPSTEEAVLVSIIAGDFGSSATWSVPSLGQKLVAATLGEEALYYVTVRTGGDTTRSATVTLHRYSLDAFADPGHSHVGLDTSRHGFNMVESNRPWAWHASLAHSHGSVGLIMNRLMHRSDDGLNHQGAFAVVFDAQTLDVAASWGQTSGHSFGSYLTSASTSGGFLGIDHGDNFPRGVHLHRFDRDHRSSRVVYTFKTKHGTTPRNPAGVEFPIYDEITEGTLSYRWSNDNNVYGELGAVIETPDGLVVSFIGEPNPDGFALDGTRLMHDYLSDPRNVGLVTVRHDFERASEGPGRNVVTDDLVVSHHETSITESGGFYAFNGSWHPQRNAGLRWLTSYTDANSEHASRLKTIALPSGSIMLIWELWSRTAFRGVRFTIVDAVGGQVVPETSVTDRTMRLSRVDDPLAHGDRAILLNGRGMTMEVVAIDLEGVN